MSNDINRGQKTTIESYDKTVQKYIANVLMPGTITQKL